MFRPSDLDLEGSEGLNYRIIRSKGHAGEQDQVILKSFYVYTIILIEIITGERKGYGIKIVHTGSSHRGTGTI